MADSPIAGFFAELKLTVDQSSFKTGEDRLTAIKTHLEAVADAASSAGDRVRKAFDGIPKNFKFTVEDNTQKEEKPKRLTDLQRAVKLGDLGHMKDKPDPNFKLPGDKVKAEEDTTKRIKEQNKEYEKSSSHLKALIGLALAYKAAKAAVGAIVDQGGKMQGTVVGAGLLGITPTEYAKLQNAMNLAGNLGIKMDAVLNMNQSLAKMMTGDDNKEKFLKSLAMLGIEPEGFLKGDVTSKITSLVTAGQKARTSGTPEQKQVATELLENVLPGSAGFTEWLGKSEYGNIFNLLNKGGGISMNTNNDYEAGSRLNDELNGVVTRFNAFVEKFVSSLGKGGLTSILNKFNDWYDGNKDGIAKAIDSFIAVLGSIASFLGGAFEGIGKMIERDNYEKIKKEDYSKMSSLTEEEKKRAIEQDVSVKRIKLGIPDILLDAVNQTLMKQKGLTADQLPTGMDLINETRKKFGRTLPSSVSSKVEEAVGERGYLGGGSRNASPYRSLYKEMYDKEGNLLKGMGRFYPNESEYQKSLDLVKKLGVSYSPAQSGASAPQEFILTVHTKDSAGKTTTNVFSAGGQRASNNVQSIFA